MAHQQLFLLIFLGWLFLFAFVPFILVCADISMWEREAWDSTGQPRWVWRAIACIGWLGAFWYFTTQHARLRRIERRGV